MPSSKYKKKEEPKKANRFIRSLSSGTKQLVSSAAKSPALLYSGAQYAPMIVAGKIGALADDPMTPDVPKVLYDNALTRALDDSALKDSYLNERYHSKGENLVSLVGGGKIVQAIDYAANSVVANAPQMIGVIGATLAGNPGAALTALGTMSASESLAKGLSAGKDVNKANLNATIDGLAEIVFESLGTVNIVKNMSKTLGKDTVKTASKGIARRIAKDSLKAMGQEALEEGLTSVVQQTSDELLDIEKLNLKERISQVVEESVIGGLSGATMAAPMVTAHHAVKTHTEKVAKKTADSLGATLESSYDDKDGNKWFVFKDKSGAKHEIKEDEFSPVNLKKELDPEFKEREEAIEQFISQEDLETNRTSIRLEKYGNDIKKTAKKLGITFDELNEILVRMPDFFRVANKPSDKLADWERRFALHIRKMRGKESENVMTDEEAKIFNKGKGWKEYSRQQGYSEEDIKEYQQRLNLIKEGKSLGLNLGDIQSLEIMVDDISDSEFQQFILERDQNINQDLVNNLERVFNDAEDFAGKNEEYIAYKKTRELLQNPEVRRIMQNIFDDFNQRGQFAMENGVINEMKPFYMPRTYDNFFEEEEIKKSSQNDVRFRRKRKFDTMLEGILTLRKRPLRKGFTGTYRNYSNKIIRAAGVKRLIKVLTKQKAIIPVSQEADFAPKGMRRIKTDDATFENIGHDQKTGYSYYAVPEVATAIENLFADSSLRNNKVIKAITKINAINKWGRLSLSGFHHFALNLAYWLTHPTRFPDIRKALQEGDFKQAGKLLHEELNPFSGFTAWKDGFDMWMESAPIVEHLVNNGLTIGRNQEWDEQVLRQALKVNSVLGNAKVSNEVRNKILNFHDMSSKLLFFYIGGGLKVKTAVGMYNAFMRKNPNADPDAVAKIVSKNVNDNFGGLHLKRMKRNPTLQHIWRLVNFAPDWIESNIRLFAKAIVGGTKSEQSFYKSVLSRAFIRGMAVTALLQLFVAAISGNDEEENKRKLGLLERFSKQYADAWEAGRLNIFRVNITPFLKKFGANPKDDYYYGFMSYFLDPIKYVTRNMPKGEGTPETLEALTDPRRIAASLGKTAYYKASFVPQAVYDALTDTDYTFYRDFTSIGDLFEKGKTADWAHSGAKPISPEQLPSWALYESGKFMPIPGQSIVDYFKGDIEGFEVLARLVGQDIQHGWTRKYKKHLKSKEKAKLERKNARKKDRNASN